MRVNLFLSKFFPHLNTDEMQSLLGIWRGEKRKEFLRSFNVFRARKPVCQKYKSYRPEYFLYTKGTVSEMEENMRRWKQR